MRAPARGDRPQAGLLRHRTTVVWAGLVLATCASWLLGTSHGLPAGSDTATAVVVLSIAFVKLRFVGLDLMELRSAPTALHAVFETYVVACYATLVALLLVSGSR